MYGVWYGTVRYGMVWYGVLCSCSWWNDRAKKGNGAVAEIAVRDGLIEDGTVRYGTVAYRQGRRRRRCIRLEEEKRERVDK